MKSFFETRPVVGSVILWAAWVLFVTLGALVLAAFVPGLPGYGAGVSASLVLILVGVVLVAGLLAAFRWWRMAGFVGLSQWRDLRLLWLPLLTLPLPLLGGLRPLERSALGILIVGYLATGFVEEGLYRGAILGLLRPTGIWRAVILSSLLFGLAHLGNILLRGNPSLVALQALGSATGGVGLAALRLRTRTIWPLIAIHALNDLFLQMGTLPVPLVDAAHDIILLVYGIYLLRPSILPQIEAEPDELRSLEPRRA
ncbi:MAG: CPBP family intramembrane glutamic endopeptidase [Anaerolineae bacterium]